MENNTDNPIEIKIVGECSKMTLNPGDRVLVKTNKFISTSQRDAVGDALRQFFGDDIRLLIYNGTEMDISKVEKINQTT